MKRTRVANWVSMPSQFRLGLPSHMRQLKVAKLWPVNQVVLLPRYAITAQQAGKDSSSEELYYLFELGHPLTLQALVASVPHRPIKNTMKLTTLSQIENVRIFSEVKPVYHEALWF